MTNDLRYDTKSSIINAAELLKLKADEIASDVDTERVKEIYITLRVEPFEAPSLDITKTYDVHKRGDL